MARKKNKSPMLPALNTGHARACQAMSEFKLRLGAEGVVPLGFGFMHRDAVHALCGKNPPKVGQDDYFPQHVCDYLTGVLNSKEFIDALDKKFPCLRGGYLKLRLCGDGRGIGVFANKEIPYDEDTMKGILLSIYNGLMYSLNDIDKTFHDKCINSDRVCASNVFINNRGSVNGIEVNEVGNREAKRQGIDCLSMYSLYTYGFYEPFGFVSADKLSDLGLDQAVIDFLSRKMLPVSAMCASFLNHACDPNCEFTSIEVRRGVHSINCIGVSNKKLVRKGDETTLDYGSDLSHKSNFYSLPLEVQDVVCARAKNKQDALAIIKSFGILNFKDGITLPRGLRKKGLVNCMCKSRCTILLKLGLTPSKFSLEPRGINTAVFNALIDFPISVFTLDPSEIPYESENDDDLGGSECHGSDKDTDSSDRSFDLSGPVNINCFEQTPAVDAFRVMIDSKIKELELEVGGSPARGESCEPADEEGADEIYGIADWEEVNEIYEATDEEEADCNRSRCIMPPEVSERIEISRKALSYRQVFMEGETKRLFINSRQRALAADRAEQKKLEEERIESAKQSDKRVAIFKGLTDDKRRLHGDYVHSFEGSAALKFKDALMCTPPVLGVPRLRFERRSPPGEKTGEKTGEKIMAAIPVPDTFPLHSPPPSPHRCLFGLHPHSAPAPDVGDGVLSGFEKEQWDWWVNEQRFSPSALNSDTNSP